MDQFAQVLLLIFFLQEQFLLAEKLGQLGNDKVFSSVYSKNDYQEILIFW
jgi:hypothetical protein